MTEPVHALAKTPEEIPPTRKHSGYKAIVYHALCGADWQQITDIPARVTCPECIKRIDEI